MQLVHEQQVPDPPASAVGSSISATTPRTTPPPDLAQRIQGELQARAAWKQGVIGSLNVAAMILGARLILLLATVGAFVLAYLAIQKSEPVQLGAVALYLCGVVLPLTWLASRR